MVFGQEVFGHSGFVAIDPIGIGGKLGAHQHLIGKLAFTVLGKHVEQHVHTEIAAVEFVAVSVDNLDELCSIAQNNSGYIKAMWCGELDCELKLKESADVSSRCIPFEGEAIDSKCVCCGRDAKKLVYWGKAY